MKFLISFIIALFLWFGVLNSIFNRVDRTDRDFWHRSNLNLHIDNETGCHYLSTWSGIITPRVDKNGKHICSGY